jgi:hypothetical protein
MLVLVKCPNCKHIQYVSHEVSKLQADVLCENEKCEVFYAANDVIKIFNNLSN